MTGLAIGRFVAPTRTGAAMGSADPAEPAPPTETEED